MLFVNLTNASTTEPTGITLAKSQGVGTILDDDPPAAAANVAQYRLYSPITYEHLYTTDTNEYAVLGTVGWLEQEGAAYTMFQDGVYTAGVYAVPLYRLYHPGVLQHHWTTDWYETTVLAAGSWSDQGIPGYVLPTAVAGTVPLYRLALAYPPLHLWTTDQNEYQVLTTQPRLDRRRCDRLRAAVMERRGCKPEEGQWSVERGSRFAPRHSRPPCQWQHRGTRPSAISTARSARAGRSRFRAALGHPSASPRPP